MALGPTFESILSAARAGAEWAWAAIYRDLSPAVLGYVRARGAAEPEDITGEVFLAIVRGLGSFEGDEHDFRTWVFTIAHHDLIDERRRRARRPVEPVPLEAMPEPLPAGNVEEEALGAIGTERVLSVLGRLSPDQRDVLALRILADLTIDQVAAVVRKRRGAVKALQRRGLSAVLRELSREGVPL